MCAQEEGCGASTAQGQLLNRPWREERDTLLQVSLGGGGRKRCPCSAPRRSEPWSGAASGFLGVLGRVGDPPSPQSLRGLCHQLRRAPPSHMHTCTHTHTHTHALAPSMGSIKRPWPAGEGMARQPRQQAHSRAPNKGGRWGWGGALAARGLGEGGSGWGGMWLRA